MIYYAYADTPLWSYAKVKGENHGRPFYQKMPYTECRLKRNANCKLQRVNDNSFLQGLSELEHRHQRLASITFFN